MLMGLERVSAAGTTESASVHHVEEDIRIDAATHASHSAHSTHSTHAADINMCEATAASAEHVSRVKEIVAVVVTCAFSVEGREVS
jgi:hypothetical protein